MSPLITLSVLGVLGAMALPPLFRLMGWSLRP